MQLMIVINVSWVAMNAGRRNWNMPLELNFRSRALFAKSGVVACSLFSSSYHFANNTFLSLPFYPPDSKRIPVRITTPTRLTPMVSRR
jgi:hypothetical protein